MKWKDWFYYTKGQRIGVIVLFVLIVLFLSLHWTMRFWMPDEPITSDAFERQAKQFLDSLQKEPDGFVHPSTHSFTRYQEYDAKKAVSLPEPVLFLFNPNELDSAGFIKLGLKPYMASNILKYRAKGGKFRKPEDFAKVWGVTPEMFGKLLPYITIPAEPAEAPQNHVYAGIVKKDVVLELNSADTTQLQQIRGIGRGYARRIVAYRNRLGGFVSVSQLNEIWGMTPDLFAQIAPHFTVNAHSISKILVNRASVERLMSHPYLNFSKAKAIYDLRRSKGKLSNCDQLKSLPEMDAASVAKIQPYLSFD
ncbi:MAG: ComEA family DNA-binding protein [Microbacter sp.]